MYRYDLSSHVRRPIRRQATTADSKRTGHRILETAASSLPLPLSECRTIFLKPITPVNIIRTKKVSDGTRLGAHSQSTLSLSNSFGGIAIRQLL